MRLVQHASKVISWYLRTSPIQRGKHFVWRATASRFLVGEVWPDIWMRTSGLTDAEKMLLLGDLKEPRSVQFIAEFLRPGMVAFDIGANIGYYTLLFASSVTPIGEVHSFEPTPALAERIGLNVSINGFSHVKINQVAVGEAEGAASLNISSEDPEANSLFELAP